MTEYEINEATQVIRPCGKDVSIVCEEDAEYEVSDTTNNIINLFIDSNKAKITSNIPEIGNVEENINIVNNENKNLNISFSSKYMMDAIKVFNSKEIELCFNGEIKPIIIKNVDSDSLIQLILPIRTF